MKDRTLRTEQDKQQAAKDLQAIPADRLPLYLTLSQGKGQRSSAANARYWANIEFFMQEINNEINVIADNLGYTNMEARRVIAEKMDNVEHALILYARSKEVVHEVLKQICNIPTSTRLGTKEFNKFSDQLDLAMSQILGEVRAIR
jgi:hypothetical protein